MSHPEQANDEKIRPTDIRKILRKEEKEVMLTKYNYNKKKLQ